MSSGYFGWTRPPFFAPERARPYLAGRYFESLNEPPFEQADAAPRLSLLPVFAGRAVVQRPYRGAGLPVSYCRQGFSGIALQADVEEDVEAVLRAAAAAAPVDYIPGLYEIDRWEGVTAGDVLLLPRRHAAGLLPEYPAGTFPPRVYLDGVEDAGAATVGESTVTANSTGAVLEVVYLAAYSVVVTVRRSYLGVNDLVFTATLEEVGL